MHSKTWALAAAIVLVTSCSNDFPAYSKLDRLRVLGVSADPPNPSAGDVCRLSALAFAPGDQPITFRWSFCPVLAQASSGYTCPLTEASTLDLFAKTLPFDLGTSDSTSFVHPFTADMLAAVCRSGILLPGFGDAVNCDQGYPVSVLLDVATPDDALRAAFTVFLPASTEADTNLNPTALGLTLAGQPLSETAIPVQLSADKAADLSVELSPDAIQMRPIPSGEGGSGVRPERLTLSWFSDAGSMDQDRTVFIDGKTSIESATHNLWTPPKQGELSPGALVRFAVVVRDDRGGVGWLTRQIRAEVTP